MKEMKIKEYHISRMTMEKGVISWEGHSLRTQGIARAWVGGMPEKSFPTHMVLVLLMIALSGFRLVNMGIMLVILGVYAITYYLSHRFSIKADQRDHVNLELYSGYVYSFASGSEAFAGQVYEAFAAILPSGAETSFYEILFEGEGKIVDHFREDESGEATIMEVKKKEGINGQIVEELKRLYECYTRKTDIDSGIMALINEAGRLVERNDKEGLKAVFGRFVTSGLINDCNELGLDSLLQEIRSMIY